MQDKALGQEAGVIAPGTQGHSINCPGRSTRRRSAIHGEEGVTEERGWWEARLIKLFGVKHSHSLRSLPCSFNLLRCWHFITSSLIVASYS